MTTYCIAAGPDGHTMTLWRGGPLDLHPVQVTTEWEWRHDPAVWALIVSTYGGTQQVTVDELEALSFDSNEPITIVGDTAYLSVDGIAYQAHLAQVPA